MNGDNWSGFEREDMLADKLRAEILVRHTNVDEVLRNLLTRVFKRESTDTEIKELFDEQRGILSSFAQKARIAYVLGLIDKATLKDLKALATIRNRFAHLVSPDFTDKKLADACKNLARDEKVTADNYLSIYREGARRCLTCLHDRL